MDLRGVDELQALNVRAVRPPEGKSAAPEGPDGGTRGCRGSPIRMLLRIVLIGAWGKSPNNFILSYKDALQRSRFESIGTTVRTRRLLWSGALLRMGDHRLPKRVNSGALENAEKRGPGGKDKEWTDCEAEDRRVFGIMRDWTNAALDTGVWYCTVCAKGAIGLWPRG